MQAVNKELFLYLIKKSEFWSKPNRMEGQEREDRAQVKTRLDKSRTEWNGRELIFCIKNACRTQTEKSTQRILTTYLKTFKINLHKYRLTEKQCDIYHHKISYKCSTTYHIKSVHSLWVTALSWWRYKMTIKCS
jgi:hypothetical protein